MSTRLDLVPVPDGRVVDRVIAGTAVLLPHRGDELIRLNSVGSFIWSELPKGGSVRDLVSAVVEAFEVDEATAHGDVAEFVEALEAKGLVALQPPVEET